MKKVVLFIIFILCVSQFAEARDYAELQIKEMKHAQKYGSTQRYFNNKSAENFNQNNIAVSSNIKDPKIMDFGISERVDDVQYNAKIKADEVEYKKIQKTLCTRTIDNYNAQAKGEDYYKLYRIAEKIIRANNLDYQNWRIGIYRDTEEPNAYSAYNYVALSSSIFDTFNNNDDALAMIIGHELGHALLGHAQRTAALENKIIRAQQSMKKGDNYAATALAVLKRKYLIESKNMEYAADAEGAKLAAKAGYNLNRAGEVIAFLETLPHESDYYSDHPNPDKRKQSLDQNRMLFIEDEWKEIGKYNIYNSQVLKVTQSSDKKSIVIAGNPQRLNSQEYYRPETLEQIYARCGYKYYINGQFEKALKYFNDLFNINTNNAPAYLYASYASEYLYKNTGKKKYSKLAKEYSKKAYELEPDNKYILEQVDSL